MSTTKPAQQTDASYYVIFEDYLQPKSSQQPRPLYGSKKLLQPQILQHSSLPPSKYHKRWRVLVAKLKNFKFSQPAAKMAPHTHHFKAAVSKVMQRLKAKRKIAQIASTPKTWRDYLAYLNLRREMPQFLAFLRARDDEHLCKPKTGFEIYCEMASVHGFKNFVGAKTWQRIFWCLVVCVAILMSILIVSISYVMSVDTPTILHTESTTYPAWTTPFPAVTICSMNRLSKRSVSRVLQNFPLSAPQIRSYFRYVFYFTDQTNAQLSDYSYLQMLLDSKNYSEANFVQDIAPDCGDELLRCKWQGHTRPCSKLFRRIPTPQGGCCAFNYHALADAKSTEPERTNSCGYKMGLTVLLQSHGADCLAAASKTAGYQVLIHAPRDYPANSVSRHVVQARTETNINVMPCSSHPTAYVGGLKLERRRCYLPGERSLQLFAHYSQINCLTECQSKMIFARCGCVPPQLPRLPRLHQWPSCTTTQVSCVLKHRDILEKSLTANRGDYKINHYAENFICSCFPTCEFHEYEGTMDSAPMDRKYTMSDRKFFKNIQIENHTLLHVFFGDLTAKRLRLDVHENWLSFVGTFGGITGLYMGYSFVSAFEMIFFVFVRPACNWLTRKQIRFRIKRRQRKAAAEQAKKQREKLQQDKVKAIAGEKPDAINQETVKTIEQGKAKVQVRVVEEKDITFVEVKDKAAAEQVMVEAIVEEANTDRADLEEKPDQLEGKDPVRVETVEQSKLSVTAWKQLQYQEIQATNDSNTIEHESADIMPAPNNSEKISFDSARTPVVEKLIEEMALLIAKEIADELLDAPRQDTVEKVSAGSVPS